MKKYELIENIWIILIWRLLLFIIVLLIVIYKLIVLFYNFNNSDKISIENLAE